MDEAEKAAELEAQKEVKEEEVRTKVIEEFGFDPDSDAERIDKAVAKEIENSKKLSAAIGQKIKHRSEAEELRKKVPAPSTEPAKPALDDVDTLVTKKLEQRDLDALDYPEDIKKEIKRIAEISSTSVKQAARDPYIVSKIADWEKEKKAEEATVSRTNRTGSKKSYSLDAPPDVDMSTPEGRAEWDEYKAWAKKQ